MAKTVAEQFVEILAAAGLGPIEGDLSRDLQNHLAAKLAPVREPRPSAKKARGFQR
jgi:hypothetical protein